MEIGLGTKKFGGLKKTVGTPFGFATGVVQLQMGNGAMYTGMSVLPVAGTIPPSLWMNSWKRRCPAEASAIWLKWFHCNPKNWSIIIIKLFGGKHARAHMIDIRLLPVKLRPPTLFAQL